MSSTDVFALAFHADYRCRHSGECCTADWDVPVELPVYRSLSDALVGGRLRPPVSARHLYPFVVEPELPHDAGRDARSDRRGPLCVLRTRHEALHRASRSGRAAPAVDVPAFSARVGAGHARHVRLAVALLSDGGVDAVSRRSPLAIVSMPPAFPATDYDGLVVTTDDLPPLLHPRVLMDLDGYSAWERHMVARCARVEGAPESVLATLMRDARLLRRWKPGGATLADTVGAFPRETVAGTSPETLGPSLSMYAEVMAAVPDDLTPEPDEVGLDGVLIDRVRIPWSDYRAPLNRYLAAKAFASWTAYQGRGITTIVRGLEAALSLVRVEAARQCRDAGRALDAELLREAFRRADFVLNHLATGEDLAASWSSAEL